MLTAPKIILTGGGTAGHVMPHLALLPALQDHGWDIHYIGSKKGIERRLVPGDVNFYAISTGKLRRQLNWRNLIMPWKVMLGFIQAMALMRRIKPHVVFSKGGFVALPVVFAAWCWRTPVVAHESDLTPGLANRLCLPLVQQLCLGFSGSKQHPKHRHKYTVTGTPVRHTMLNGSAEQGRKLCGFHKEHPIVLVFGGSLGAQAINQTIEQARQEWSNQWQVIHISGQENNAPSNTQQYCHFSFVQDEFPHLLACADVVISRAGANTLAELVACRKPHVLIPLPLTVSRGDQIENASYFQEQGLSQVIPQDHLDSQSLLQAIEFCLAHHTDIKKRLQNYQDNHALPLILKILTLYAPSVEKADPTI